MKGYAKRFEHLNGAQRTKIRWSRRSPQVLARQYGVKVRTILLLWSTRQPDHPARIAAQERRQADFRRRFPWYRD